MSTLAIADGNQSDGSIWTGGTSPDVSGDDMDLNGHAVACDVPNFTVPSISDSVGGGVLTLQQDTVIIANCNALTPTPGLIQTNGHGLTLTGQVTVNGLSTTGIVNNAGAMTISGGIVATGGSTGINCQNGSSCTMADSSVSVDYNSIGVATDGSSSFTVANGSNVVGTGSLPSVNDVRNGVTYGTLTGNLIVPDGSQVLLGIHFDSSGGAVGAADMPDPSTVLLGVTYNLMTQTGTYNSPPVESVAQGVSVGSDVGHLIVSLASDVRAGIFIGDDRSPGTGTLDLPSAFDVRYMTQFDQGNQTGTLVLPDPISVASGVQYGGNGTEFTGTDDELTDLQSIGGTCSQILSTLNSAYSNLATNTANIYNRIGPPAGANVSTDIAAVKADTASSRTKTNSLTFTVSGRVDATAVTVSDKTGYSGTATNFVAAPTTDQINTALAGAHGSGSWGSGSITILPAMATTPASPLGNFPPLVALQHRAINTSLTVFQSDNVTPANLLGVNLKLTVYDGYAYDPIFTLTTGAGLAVGGADHNIVTITATNVDTSLPNNYFYALDNTDTNTTLGSNTFTIKPFPIN